MKKIIYIICILTILINSCASQKNTPISNDDQVVIKNEELEYEIIIIEPGFNAWLATQQPMINFSQSSLEVRNQRLVTEWNTRVLQPNRYNPNFYQMQIDYQHNVDYGIEVNYLLFMYFKFFQQRYNQRL